MLLNCRLDLDFFDYCYVSSKGKQATKGNKQVIEENVATLKFYRNMCIIFSFICILFSFIFYGSFGAFHYVLLIVTVSIHLSSYYFMISMSKPRYTDNGVVLDSGNDLNIEGGIAEHVKDIIILTAGAQLTSLLSTYFWCLLILAPLRAFWLMWKHFIGPWLCQRSEESNQFTEKKPNKNEKKIKRVR
uniref:Transmembrane protein 208 n=1 Tax=Culex pipiens TaxID=7175 RepID=A0A8D8DYQ7_CULPI